MTANNRIYYATQAILLKPQTTGNSYSGWYAPQGMQSVGITTNFSVQPVFQMGQLELYDLIESVPEIEVSMNKVLDGTPPLYALCMCGSSGLTTGFNSQELAELSNNRVNLRLGIYPDTQVSATGDATHFVDCSGLYLNRFSYTIPIDGNATEEITLVGNNKYWNSGLFGNTTMTINEFKSNNSSSTGTFPTAPGIARRVNLDLTNSVFPTGNYGDSGCIPLRSSGTIGANYSNYGSSSLLPHFQSISISADLNREAIYELGSMAPYHRYVRFPLEIRSEFSIIGTMGDHVKADDFTTVTGCNPPSGYRNLKNKTIRIQICGGTGTYTGSLVLNLGDKNKLTSVNYNGGGTDGSNATISYSFVTYNKFNMQLNGTYGGATWVDNTADTENYGAFSIGNNLNKNYLNDNNPANIMGSNRPKRLFKH